MYQDLSQTLPVTFCLDCLSALSVSPLFLNPHASCQRSTPNGMTRNNIQTSPESSNTTTEKTQNIRLMHTSEGSRRSNPNPSSGTASRTCMGDSTKDKLAKIKRSGAITRSTYIVGRPMRDFIEPFRRRRRRAKQANSPIQLRKAEPSVMVAFRYVFVLDVLKMSDKPGPPGPFEFGWKERRFAQG